MATRTNDLTEFAKPIADELAARCGSLKRVLSAGVFALKALPPHQREIFMAKAIGKEIKSASDLDIELEQLWVNLEKIAKKMRIKIKKPRAKKGDIK